MIRRRVPCEADADDIVQEAFLRICRHAHRLDPDKDPWPWIRRIGINVAIDRHRWGPHRREEDITRLVHAGDDHHRTDPLRQVCDAEHAAALRAAWTALEGGHRELLARCAEGWSYQEIGVHFSLSEHTVRGRLRRARAQLRVLLAQAERGLLSLLPIGLVHRFHSRARQIQPYGAGAVGARAALGVAIVGLIVPSGLAALGSGRGDASSVKAPSVEHAAIRPSLAIDPAAAPPSRIDGGRSHPRSRSETIAVGAGTDAAGADVRVATPGGGPDRSIGSRDNASVEPDGARTEGGFEVALHCGSGSAVAAAACSVLDAAGAGR